jgi:hypothetical protein
MVFGIFFALASFVIFYPNIDIEVILVSLGLLVEAHCFAEFFRSYWQVTYGVSKYGKEVKSTLIAIDVTFIFELSLLVVNNFFANIFAISLVILEFAVLLVFGLMRTNRIAKDQGSTISKTHAAQKPLSDADMV